jgi:anhydro-N-acetylmuramic acid kinase
MTGTSADGVDAVVVRVERGARRRHTTLLAHCRRPFPDDLRGEILRAQEGDLSMRRLFPIHVAIARVSADAARDAIADSEIRGAVPDVAGFHGQTVFHDPHGERSGVPLTAQIGEPTVLARELGCPVVSNFRMADVLEGGEGAPLVPLFDYHQFSSETEDRVLLNLGGIANLTRLKRGGTLADINAFDCGPGNMLLDGIMAALGPAGARFDAGGATAARGRADEAVVREFLADEFIARRPPKSAGRERYGASYRDRFLARTGDLPLPDRLRTAVAITAGAVARGVAHSGPGRPDEVIVSGGGARNETLIGAIRAALGAPRVVASDSLGVPAEAKEAMAFAFLAAETLAGRAGNVPAATGARKEVVLGSITPPPTPR